MIPLTDNDMIALAGFFDEYLSDGDLDISNELTEAVNKIFKYTSWFEPKNEDAGWSD